MSENRDRKRGLGRGLSALMADVADPIRPDVSGENVGVRVIPIENIVPNPEQPRRTFDPMELDNLAHSIREKGVIQPLIVRPIDSGLFEIVAGERRWRAAQMAQLHELPTVVRNFTDVEVLEVAIVENIQRADLNAIEEAAGYRQLMDRFGHTQEKLSEALGKSRSHIANLLRLLNLPEPIVEMLRQDQLSAGHARALIPAEDPVALAMKVVSEELSVRATEALVKRQKSAHETGPAQKKRPETEAEKDADTRALEADLSAQLGLRVTLAHNAGDEGGKLTLSYKSLEQLDDLCRILSGS